MENFFDLMLKRIEKFAFVQKEQNENIKSEMVSITKAYTATQEQVDEIKTCIARGQAAFTQQVDDIKSEVASITRLQAGSKEQMDAIKNDISGTSRLQSHPQRKQDQLASKQDLLHSTIANEKQRSLSVMSSPLLSPPVATWNQLPRSVSTCPEIVTKPKPQTSAPLMQLDFGDVEQQKTHLH